MGRWMRMKTLLAANVNALVEQAEDPAKMLRLLIQQMEDASQELRRDIIGATERERQLKSEAEQSRSEAGDRVMDEQLDALDTELRALCQQQLQLEEHMDHAVKTLTALETPRHQHVSSSISERKSTRLDRKMARTDARMQRFHQRLDSMEAEVEAFDLLQRRSTTGAGA